MKVFQSEITIIFQSEFHISMLVITTISRS